MAVALTQVQSILKKKKVKAKERVAWAEMEKLLVRDKLILPTPYLSPSQIEMYIRCPKQYEFRYVNKIKSPPGVALVEGSSHHEALALNNNFKRRTGRDHKIKKVFDRFADEFNDRSKEVENWEGEKKDTIIKRGKEMLTTYLDQFAPRVVKPERVEEKVEMMVQNVPILGVLDLMSDIKEVAKKTSIKSLVDYKTATKAKSQGELDGSIQLSIYLMFARDVFKIKGKINVGFGCLYKNNGSFRWQSVPATTGRVIWTRRIILQVADAISRGSFPPTSPTEWCCDPKWCGYYSQCRGKYD